MLQRCKRQTAIRLIPGCALVVLAALAGCAGASQPPESSTVYEVEVRGQQVRLVLANPLPEVPSSILSYQIIPPDVTVEYVADIGARLGFTGIAASTDPGVIAMSKPEQRETLQVHTSTGAIEYTCLNKLFPLAPELPDDQEAASIATEFLKQAGLWFPDVEVKEVVVGGTTGPNPAHLLVNFARSVGGMPLTGPGKKFGVRVGDQGEVVSMFVYYPELMPDKAVRVISAAAALDIFIANDSDLMPSPYFVPPDCHEIVIDGVSPAYYLETVDTRQDLLLPVYLFTGAYIFDDGMSSDFSMWVNAVA